MTNNKPAPLFGLRYNIAIRGVVPEAGINGMYKQLYPADTVRWNYLSVSLILASGTNSPEMKTPYIPYNVHTVLLCFGMFSNITISKCETYSPVVFF